MQSANELLEGQQWIMHCSNNLGFLELTFYTLITFVMDAWNTGFINVKNKRKTCEMPGFPILNL